MGWCDRLYEWCFCCKRNKSEWSLLTHSSAPQKGSYTVRRISSFGQTVINEKGEECEIERHSSIVQTKNGCSGPLPWVGIPTTVQPGVTEAEFVQRIRKMPTISESEPGLKREHALVKEFEVDSDIGRGKEMKKKNNWRRALANVKFRAGERAFKSELQVRAVSVTSRETLESTVDSEINIFQRNELKHDELGRRSRRESSHRKRKKLGVGNVRRASCMIDAQSRPFTESTPDLRQTEDPMCLANTFCTMETVSSVELREAAMTVMANACHSISPWNVNDTVSMSSSGDALARMHGLDLSLYKEVPPFSMPTISAAIVQNNLSHSFLDLSTGTIIFSTCINRLAKQLWVGIERLQNLSGEGSRAETYEVIMKLCLLPGKRSIRTSPPNLNHNNLNLNFNLPLKDSTSNFLRISIYNAKWMGSHDAVGHSLLCLDNVHENTSRHELKLYQRSVPEPSAGLIEISIGYFEDCLNITVIKAYNLVPELGESKLYLKIAYYSSSKKLKEKTSGLKESSGDEVHFEHCVKFRGIDPLHGGCHDLVSVSVRKRETTRGVFKRDITRGRVLLGPWIHSGFCLTPWGSALLNSTTIIHTFPLYL